MSRSWKLAFKSKTIFLRNAQIYIFRLKKVFFQDLVSQSDFINMGYMFGMLVGSFLFGIISDKIGRKKALLISGILSAGT